MKVDIVANGEVQLLLYADDLKSIQVKRKRGRPPKKSAPMEQNYFSPLQEKPFTDDSNVSDDEFIENLERPKEIDFDKMTRR